MQNTKAVPGSSALDGVVDIIHALIQHTVPDISAPAPRSQVTPASVSVQPASVMLLDPIFNVGPDMPITQFCTNYGLQPAIHQKLDENGYDYARNLGFITLENLAEMGFKLGEKAAIQDAVEQWAVCRT